MNKRYSVIAIFVVLFLTFVGFDIYASLKIKEMKSHNVFNTFHLKKIADFTAGHKNCEIMGIYILDQSFFSQKLLYSKYTICEGENMQNFSFTECNDCKIVDSHMLNDN